MKAPCNPDHNGECLVCDCWLDNCAYDRYLKNDYTYETRQELEDMFGDDLWDHYSGLPSPKWYERKKEINDVEDYNAGDLLYPRDNKGEV